MQNPSPDVTTPNPAERIYLSNNQRIRIDEDTGIPIIQEMIEGIWQPGPIEASPETIYVGRRVGAAGIGHHFATKDVGGNLHFHAHKEFNGKLTTGNVKIVDAFNFQARRVLQADNSGTYTGQNFESQFYAVSSVLSSQRYFQTGLTVPTTPITFKIWEGNDDTGLLIFKQMYPAEDFPADSEIELSLDGYFETDEGKFYFTRITCDTDFSIKTNFAGTAPWVAVDDSDLREDDMLQTLAWKSGGNFVVDQWCIQNKKIYVCNVEGVQTGVFAENSDKWNTLSQDNFTWETVVENSRIKIPENHQMTVHDVFNLEGDLFLEGTLVLRA